MINEGVLHTDKQRYIKISSGGRERQGEINKSLVWLLSLLLYAEPYVQAKASIMDDGSNIYIWSIYDSSIYGWWMIFA